MLKNDERSAIQDNVDHEIEPEQKDVQQSKHVVSAMAQVSDQESKVVLFGVENLRGFSGANIEGAVISAVYKCVQRYGDNVTARNLKEYIFQKNKWDGIVVPAIESDCMPTCTRRILFSIRIRVGKKCFSAVRFEKPGVFDFLSEIF